MSKNGKKSKPDKEDALIILRLAELAGTMDTQAGSELIWNPEFEADPAKHGPGTPEHRALLQLMRWMETIGTLYRNGLVSEDLLFDWLDIAGPWGKVKPIAVAMREHTNPALWENFEFMAERQRDWKPRR